MPKALKGDHTIVTPRLAYEPACKGPVTPSAEATAAVKSRKTPSPTAKPPSPTNFANRKTPSPTPFSRSGGRSPIGGQRSSPTFNKGASSPTRFVGERPSVRQPRSPQVRSASSGSPDPTDYARTRSPSPSPMQRPASPAVGKRLSPKPAAAMLRQSKSSSSYAEQFGRAERRPRRDSCDAEDERLTPRTTVAKQSSTVGTQTDPVEDDASGAGQLVRPQATRPRPGEAYDERFLENIAKIQGELAMAVCSGMELIAERGAGAAMGAAAAVGPQTFAEAVLTTKTTQQRFDQQIQQQQQQPWPGRARAGEAAADTRRSKKSVASCDSAAHGSDSECDEVRSLSLSEEGPVYSRSCNWRLMRAPDPIAMLSNGQHKAARVDGESSGDELLDESADGSLPRNDSDRSIATTRIGGGAKGASPAGKEESLSGILAPILSKITSDLDVVAERAGEGAGRRLPTRVPATKPAPERRKPGERRAPAAGDVALALSEVRLVHDGGGEQRPTSTRSDVSIGSMCSAFTSLSSSASGSQLNSPRGAARTLTTSASMPAGTFPKRQYRRLN
mmetsp:Transcript_5364/g.15918  ORF Transcript_5364/g.15918 Transcript_5364/m.15918 type:complete len:561 (+) Transcript_5364:111-1793(+)